MSIVLKVKTISRLGMQLSGNTHKTLDSSPRLEGEGGSFTYWPHYYQVQVPP